MAKITIPARSSKLWFVGLFIIALIVSLAVSGVYADEEQTPSEMAKIGYRNVGKVMSEVSGAEVDKSNLINKALAGLFTELANHLKKKNVPDHVVNKFTSRAESLMTLYEEDVITKKQLGYDASNIVQNAGRHDPDGKVPTSVLEKAGMGQGTAKTLSVEGEGSVDVAEVTKKMAQAREKKNKQSRIKEETKTKKKSQKTNQEQNQEQNEEKKGKSENSEEKGESSRGQKGNSKAKENGKSEKGKPEKNSDNGQSKKGSENQSADQMDASSDPSQKGEKSEEVGQEQEGPGNSGNNPGNSGNKGKGNGDKEKGEKEDDENPGKGKGKGKGNGKGKGKGGK